MKLRHIIIIAIFVGINLAVFFTLNYGGGEEKEEKQKEEFVQVLEARNVKNTKEQFEIVGYGTITSFNAVDISAEVQGKLFAGKQPLKPGVKIRKGQTIFSISDADAQYNLRSRKSGFINIIAQMLPDIRIDFASEYEKWSDYVASIKLNRELPTLPAWSSDKEKVFLATRNVLTEYFSIKSLEEQLSKYYIQAPYNCVITEVYVSEYSVVNPGAKIVRIAQTDNFELSVPVPVSSLDAIEVGTKGEVFSTGGELKGVATVVRISEVINKTTQSVNVYLRPKAIEGNRFIEGEYVRVEIDEVGEFSGIRLPRQAVSDGQVYTYKKADSTLVPTKVSVLDVNENGVFVSGLQENETVIIQEVLNYADTLKYGILVKE